MRFDYDKFIGEICSTYAGDFTCEEIKNILGSEDEYEDRDTPLSTGKRLIITNVCFKGRKSSGETINFSQKINMGVNIWIADNLKGKSSLFKIIKFALTGNSSLKHDVKKWLTHILVGFKINDKHYSIYLNTESKQLLSKLFNGEFDSILTIENAKTSPVIESRGIKNYTKEIENFFFKQFSYYSLKWTQKNPKKNVNELNESKASWKTYFKSIVLESKDSGSLIYGNQQEKVFQMLIGLELTYPINRLTIKKDFLEFEKGKLESSHRTQIGLGTSEKEMLEHRLTAVDAQIKEDNSLRKEKSYIHELYQKYESVTQIIEQEHSKRLLIQRQLQKNESRLQQVETKQNSTQIEYARIRKELQKSQRSIGDLQEFIDIGIFFSNLDIKHCPNCNHKVSESRKSVEQLNHECSLCHESIQDKEGIHDDIIYQNKIKSLRFYKKELKKETKFLQEELDELQVQHNSISKTINGLKNQINSFSDLTIFKKELFDLERKINLEKEKALPDEKQRYALISEKAIIEFQLQQISNDENTKSANKLSLKIQLLEYAIEKLQTQRYEIGKELLENLSGLMLSEIHKFGLNVSFVQLEAIPEKSAKNENADRSCLKHFGDELPFIYEKSWI